MSDVRMENEANIRDDEAEACAKIADGFGGQWHPEDTGGQIASAIRARIKDRGKAHRHFWKAMDDWQPWW